MEFYETHKTFVTQTGMSHEKNIDKLRILTLMTLAENNKELPFDLLQKQLKIEADEIESFVIDGNWNLLQNLEDMEKNCFFLNF